MAGSLNKATLIGNLTRDPELRKTPAGQSVTSFGIATNRSYTGADGVKKEQADFHNVVAWGKLAEICAQYLFKGKKVYVDGRLQTRDWEGQDGVKKNRTEIIIENMIMLDKPGTQTAGQALAGQVAGAGATADNLGGLKDEPPVVNEEEIKLEDIPF